LSTRRPLTTTAIAAGLGTIAALTLGPIASAATSQAGARVEHPATAKHTASGLALADTGTDTTPYAMGGAGFLVAGVGMIFISRRFSH
jgi:LPXTG-motif cell wall-anchored protein